jgi:hypothetical protein
MYSDFSPVRIEGFLSWLQNVSIEVPTSENG